MMDYFDNSLEEALPNILNQADPAHMTSLNRPEGPLDRAVAVVLRLSLISLYTTVLVSIIDVIGIEIKPATNLAIMRESSEQLLHIPPSKTPILSLPST